MTALIITLALLSRGHDHAVDSTFKKLLEKKKHFSPFLSGILVDRMREDQLLKLVESLKDDDETTILRVSKLGEDKWVLSFPIGIKIGSFMDLILALYLEIDEDNPSFTQIENKGEVYIPINLQETISKGAVIKQVKIDNSFA